jgi:hypothetical protein
MWHRAQAVAPQGPAGRPRRAGQWLKPGPCEGTTLVAGAVDQHVAVGIPDRAAGTVLRRLTAWLTAQLTAALATVRLQPSTRSSQQSKPPKAGKAPHGPAQPVAQQRPHVGGMVLDAGQPPDHQRDALQDPQLADKTRCSGTHEQHLLDLGELRVRQPGRRSLGPRLRNPPVQLAFQRRCQTLTAWAETPSRQATSAWWTPAANSSAAQPTGLKPVTCSLCRRSARDGWHARDPHLSPSPAPTRPARAQPDTHVLF